MAWRYFAQRITGDGAGTFIDLDLPLTGVTVENVLSGPDRISGQIPVELGTLIAEDGRPVLEEWGTAIYAEESGEIRAGCIVVVSRFSGSTWDLDCMGFAGYPGGMPYNEVRTFIREDPLAIVRHIWEHLQGQEGGNLDVVVDATTSPVRIGTDVEQVSFTTGDGEGVSFEAGPKTLAWWMTDDLGREIDDLAAATPFDYREEHSWADEDSGLIEHRIRLGYPKLGRRRRDLRFVVGENIGPLPDVERDAEDFANEVIALGAGEGRDMVSATDQRRDGRIRRVAVVTDKNVRSKRNAQALARAELAARQGFDEITSIIVRDHANARLGSWKVGDEILVQGDVGWVDLEVWCRVISTSINPESGEVATLSLVRTDAVIS